MKKLLSLLLAAIMVLGIVAVPAFADATVALTVTGVGATVKPGDEFTAELRVPKFSDPVSGYELHINFEKKILEVTDVQFTGYNDSMVTNAEEANRSNPESNAGSVVSTMARAENTVLAEDLVLTVKFKVRSDAASGTYDKLVWINEEATAFGNVDEAGNDGLITVNFGNKTFGAKVEGGNTTVIPEGAPFTAVYTDIEGAPVTVTKQDGKEDYTEINKDYDGGETDRWHIVVPENAQKLYLVYPKSAVKYLNDGYTKMALGYQKYYYVGSDQVDKGLFQAEDFEIKDENIIIAIKPNEFVGVQQTTNPMSGVVIKYTRGFTFRDNNDKATGHITIEYGEAYTEDTPVIPEGAPFTAVYTDIEGAPVTVTKQDGKEDYTEINKDYDGGETDRWHIVVPENAQKLYLVYPKSAVKYLNDGYTKMALGYQKYYYVGSDQVDKGLFQAEDFEIKDENIIIAIKPNEFVGVQQTTNPMSGVVIKYTRGFTFRDNNDKATGHITIEYGEAYYSDEDAAKAVDDLIAAIGKVEFTDESKGKIDAARAAYDKLTDAQKKLVKNLKVLTDAEAEYERLKKAAEDEAAAKAVDDLIAAIGKVEFTDESKGKIDAARAAYDKLTDAQKKLVKNLKVLTDAEAEYERLKKAAEDEAAAKAVDNLIAAIGKVEFTDESKGKIDAARAAYDKLTDAQKKLVKNLKVLTDAEAEYERLKKAAEDEAAAKAVDNLIAAIGKVEFTDESKGKIDAARAAYDKLTDAQKKLVKNLKVLTDAEAEYQRLLDQHKADEAAAKAVDDMVNKLQPVTVNSGKAIEAARKAFDALTPAQKKLLDPKTEGKLVAAENEYKVLIKDNADEMAAKEVEDKIARLQPVTKDSGEAIKDARSSYEALTPEQKALVSKDSVAALDKAEKLYDMIIASTKPGTAVGDNTGSTSGSGVIKITANGDSKGEKNPNTGAPAMSIAPAMLVLAAAALVLKKHK